MNYTDGIMKSIQEMKSAISEERNYKRIMGETDDYVCFEAEKIESLFTYIDALRTANGMLHDENERYERALKTIESESIDILAKGVAQGH